MKTKEERFTELVAKFKAHAFADNTLRNPFAIAEAKLDGDYLSPWNLWHGNLDAKVLLVGQDFSSVDYFIKNVRTNWQPEKESPTNKSLGELFSILGYEIGLPDATRKNTLELFFTNAVLGIKEGGMNAPIKTSWYKETKSFLRGAIDIIEPELIIAMGATAYKAVLNALNKKVELQFKEAVGTGEVLPDGTALFIVAHCSGLGKVNRNFDQQKRDWEGIKDFLDAAV